MNHGFATGRCSFRLLVVGLTLCSSLLLAQDQTATKGSSNKSANSVTFGQQAQAPSPSTTPRHIHDSFCSDEAWDYYFDHYEDGVQTDSVEPLEPVQSMSPVNEIPDERAESMTRAEEIPDERVQEIPDERVGPPVPPPIDSFGLLPDN